MARVVALPSTAFALVHERDFVYETPQQPTDSPCSSSSPSTQKLCLSLSSEEEKLVTPRKRRACKRSGTDSDEVKKGDDGADYCNESLKEPLHKQAKLETLFQDNVEVIGDHRYKRIVPKQPQDQEQKSLANETASSTTTTASSKTATTEEIPLLIMPLSIAKEYEMDQMELEFMHNQEKSHQPESKCLFRHPKLEAEMRAVLLDWMIEVSQEFGFGYETLQNAMNMVDRVLSIAWNVQRNRFQLLATACLYISCKLEESHSSKAADFVLTTASAFTARQIVQMEKQVLSVLNWKLMSTTPFSWMKFLVMSMSSMLLNDPSVLSEVTGEQRKCLIESLLLTDNFTRAMQMIAAAYHDVGILEFLPSIIVVSALSLVIPSIRDLAIEVCRIDDSEIRYCVEFLRPFSVLDLKPVAPYKGYYRIKMSISDAYTRQIHHPGMLPLYRQLHSLA